MLLRRRFGPKGGNHLLALKHAALLITKHDFGQVFRSQPKAPTAGLHTVFIRLPKRRLDAQRAVKPGR